jgi:hypothetical protein
MTVKSIMAGQNFSSAKEVGSFLESQGFQFKGMATKNASIFAKPENGLNADSGQRVRVTENTGHASLEAYNLTPVPPGRAAWGGTNEDKTKGKETFDIQFK